jgi:hypothetical protein
MQNSVEHSLSEMSQRRSQENSPRSFPPTCPKTSTQHLTTFCDEVWPSACIFFRGLNRCRLRPSQICSLTLMGNFIRPFFDDSSMKPIHSEIRKLTEQVTTLRSRLDDYETKTEKTKLALRLISAYQHLLISICMFLMAPVTFHSRSDCSSLKVLL